MTRAYILFLVALLIPSIAAAESVAILGIEADNAPEAEAARLTEALRQRMTGAGKMKVVPGKDYVELKMVFGCVDDTSATCMAQAGRSIGADKLIYGTLKGAGGKGKYSLNLRLLDVKTGNVDKYIPNEQLSSGDLASGSVNAVATRLLTALVGLEARASLTITTSEPGATVVIDDQVRGQTPVTLTDVGPGQHVLVVRKDGFAPHTETVTIRAGEATKVDATLTPAAAVVEPTKTVETPVKAEGPKPVTTGTTHPGRVPKIVGAIALGLAAVSGGIAIYTWRSYRGKEDDAHNALTEIVNSGNNSAYVRDQAEFFRNPDSSSCKFPPPSMTGIIPPSTAVGSPGERFTNACESGNTMAGVTTGMLISTGVFAAAGVTALVIGFRAKPEAEKPAATTTFAPRLRALSPTAGPGGAGISATFEF